MPYLSRFHKEYPNVHIKVTNASSTGCVDLLVNGQVDFIVTNYPNSRLNNTNHIHTIKKFQDVFVANKAFFDLEDKELTFRELLDYPILMLDRQSTTSEFLHQLFLQHELDLVPEIELSSNDLLLDLASIGLGIAFLPDYLLSDTRKDLYPLKLKEELPQRELVIVTNEPIPLSPAAREFIRYLS